MIWALAALVLSVGLLGATVWFWRGKAAVDAALMRPPPPHGFANLTDAEWDFVELEIWEEVFTPLDEAPDVKRQWADAETRVD